MIRTLRLSKGLELGGIQFGLGRDAQVAIAVEVDWAIRSSPPLLQVVPVAPTARGAVVLGLVAVLAVVWTVALVAVLVLARQHCLLLEGTPNSLEPFP